MKAEKIMESLEVAEKRMAQDRYLFRGKRPTSGKWVEGALVYDTSGTCYIISEMMSEITCCDDCGMPGMDYNIVNPTTVGQCTGLKDKNGELIFEGDLVTVTGYSYDEPTSDDSGEIYITPLGCCLIDDETFLCKNIIDLQGSYTTTYEIYGNIHDKEGEDEV